MAKMITQIVFAAFALVARPIGPLAAATPLKPGTISVETSSAHPAPGYSVDAFVDAVGEKLTNISYTILEGRGHARLVAEIHLTQIEIGTAQTKVPPAEAPKIAGSDVAGVGGNITVPLRSRKLRVAPILQTRLEIRIKKLGEEEVQWVGTALTVRPSNSGNGREKVVAADLAKAIFTAFPAQLESVITVP